MDETRSFTRSPMSIHPLGGDWLKMPTERLQAALAAEPEDSGNAKVIRSVLEARSTAQMAKTLATVAESNRALTEQLKKISARNEATSRRLGRITFTLFLLAAIAVGGAVFVGLRK